MRPNIGFRLRELRKEKNLTMKQLAEKIGLTEQAISQYERGIRTPSSNITDKLCEALDIKKTDLYLWDIMDLG